MNGDPMSIWDILIFLAVVFGVLYLALRISGRRSHKNLHKHDTFKETKRLRDEMMNRQQRW